ncbi:MULTISPECIES: ABC transporter substrate-binding protein [Rhodopseudomonas]|uniref:ABC transporter substrate-binding protein n=1 Tax=Rhodopseudomonas TaxID=1073 RepID=UPI0006971DDF|nr:MULTISPECIES: ABC transporter substrate-binding protein [Rhodopseudomonas]MDF3809379.1 ABC transporter substrate-binding protein [Rhodopseudomonas sp. BAL398]WOK16949.1 ABC transporter substrate-binding protein [Rhodopseudomonas sp. BAL398]
MRLESSDRHQLRLHAIPKQAAQAIRKIGEIGWHPTFFLAATTTSVSTVLKPAGLEYAKGIITTYYMKDPNDPQWQNDKGVQDWKAFRKNYLPDGNIQDQSNVYGYTVAQAMVEVIRQCGDDLTRENIMKQATNLDLALPMLLPGIKVKTSPTDYFPIEAQSLRRFNGEAWELFGEVSGD